MDQKILEKLEQIEKGLQTVAADVSAHRQETKAEFTQLREVELTAIRKETQNEFIQLRKVDLPNVIASLAEANGDIFDEIDKQKADKDDVTYLTRKVNNLEKKLAS